jgi:hypothetical protein
MGDRIVQKGTADYSINLEALGALESVEIRIFKGYEKKTIATFIWPAEEGDLPLVKNGTTYSFRIPSGITDVNECTFGFELEAVTEGLKVVKAQTGFDLNIIKKAQDEPIVN